MTTGKKSGNLRATVLVVAALTVLGLDASVDTSHAAVQTVTSTIKYLSDLTWTTVASPNLGYGKAATAGVYALSTAGVVTPSGGGVSEGGTPAAGNYTIKGSGSQSINLTAGNYVVNGASTPSLGVCKYGAAASATCNQAGLAAPTAGGTTLLVGLTVTVTAATADGNTNSPTFDLTVVYQ